MFDSKKPLEPTELSYIIEEKVKGDISGEPSGVRELDTHCLSCGRHNRIKMSLNPKDLSELIRIR